MVPGMTAYEYIEGATDSVVKALAEWHPHVEDESEDALLARAAKLAISRGLRPAISRAWGREAGAADARWHRLDVSVPHTVELWTAAARSYHGTAYAEGYREGMLSTRRG